MRKDILKKINQKGSLMVEALALLGLITMVTPILYKKAAERTTELQDINVATQMRMISSAVDDYIKDNYQEVSSTYDADVFKLSDEDRQKLEAYMPYGFNMQTSRLFDDFDISVRREQVEDNNGKIHNVYTTAVLAPLKDANFTRARASKIASMIGANGGLFDPGFNPDSIEGVQGSWQAQPNEYDFDVEGINRALAVISSKAIASARGDVSSDEVLYKIDTGDDAKNTMQTTLYMDGNDLQTVHNIIAQTNTGSGPYVDGGVTSNREVVIGRKDVAEYMTDLFVTGSANIANDLRVNGLSEFVGDAKFGRDVDITGDLSVNGDTIMNGTLDVKGDAHFERNVQIDEGLNVNGKTTLTELEVNGPAIFNENVTMNKDLTVNGDTTLKNLTVTGDAKFENNVYIDGDLILPDESDVMANWLYANSGIKVGGRNADGKSSPGHYFELSQGGLNLKSGEMNVRDNLKVDANSASFAKNNFSVGNNKIAIDDSETFIGYRNDKGLSMGMDRTTLKQDNNTYLNLNGANGDVTLKTENAFLELRNYREEVELKTGTTGLTLDPGSWEMTAADNSRVAVDENGVFAVDVFNSAGDMNMTLNQKGLAFSTDGGSIVKEASSVGDSILDSNTKVGIGRQGIIEVTAPTKGEEGGYIKARRLVSDKQYPFADAYNAAGGWNSGTDKAYDYYQVNPAYTSVMNDIKLASRGGARLSDILSDYVNKGIYVVDNTYASKESLEQKWAKGEDLPYSDIAGMEASPSCELGKKCIASPWLGFVPTPQCPPNYASVIAVNPIRWRMAEVFSLYNALELTGATSDDDLDHHNVNSNTYKTNILNNFSKYFWQNFDPKLTEFKTGGPVDVEGEYHEHYAKRNRPLTFQTNTWLNSTIYKISDGSEFAGWNVVMGFLYRPSDYGQLLTDLGYDTTDVFWNIFPVYAGEMAAIANVYCFFERRYKDTSSWKWGEDSPVYRYDQLLNYRNGLDKDEKWSKAVNDPDLGYTDAW